MAGAGVELPDRADEIDNGFERGHAGATTVQAGDLRGDAAVHWTVTGVDIIKLRAVKRL
jgi:hypothetical protein